MLGPELGHVPILIPLAWFMMIYPSWATARALVRGVDTQSPAGIAVLGLIAAMVMTAWDTVMDPGMSAAGNWVWEKRGAYFGVPLQNYFGWLVTTFVVYCCAGFLWRGTMSTTPPSTFRATRIFAALPVVVYAFHGLRYVTAASLPALRVVALFAMGLPGLLALVRTWMADPETELAMPR